MMIRTIKVYTVRIEPKCLSKFWYYNEPGAEFDCILVSKETSGIRSAPVFAVVDKLGDSYYPPQVIRTIRPEDCTVVKEKNDLYNSLSSYRETFRS